ncbi:unnamed protein product [Pseudo-nitzschia multistriata]|uniref:Uncharacterized protein n=1 Tax=Pseudo-nitzschia multistriata TaxID=183589 RepID=A0A448Z4T8_9STRA|nr:unnamed protein product [Pseudo-nitzschia multistriata]
MSGSQEFVPEKGPKMRDSLPSAPQSGWDGFEFAKKEVNQSIANSITNDEDDWDGPRENSEHSIVHSVTNDDELNESRTDNDGEGLSILPRPCNYKTAFSTAAAKTNRYTDKKKDATIEELRTSPPSSPTAIEQRASSRCSFDQESFLIRYERMMKGQEVEQTTTISYVQSLLDLLESIQPEEIQAGKNYEDAEQSNPLLREISLEQLKRMYTKLENLGEYDTIKIDKQFLMVLEIFCEEKEAASTIDNIEKNEEKVSWAEIIQCYRSCVLGMQTLEIIGPHTMIRKRAKERILAMLSLYRKSSFEGNDSLATASSMTPDVASSKITWNDKSNISSKVNQRRYQGKTQGWLLNFIAFVTGVMIATLSFQDRSSSAHRDAISENTNKHTECPIAGKESFSSVEQQFEDQFLENMTYAPLPDQSKTNETRTFKKRNQPLSASRTADAITSAQKPHDLAIFPSDFSELVTAFDPKFGILSTDKEGQSDKATKIPLNDIKVASMIGGFATGLYVLTSTGGVVAGLLSWLPMGMTVMIATLTAHGIRDGISGIWKKFRRNKKKRDQIFT